MIDAQAVAYGPPASRAPHAPCGSADLPQVHAARDRGARDDDVAAVVARGQSPRFIANKFARAAKDCALSLTWSGRATENAGLLSDNIVRGLSGDFLKTPLSQTSAVGATLSFPRTPAKVPSPFDLPTVVRCIADCNPRHGEPPARRWLLLHTT